MSFFSSLLFFFSLFSHPGTEGRGCGCNPLLPLSASYRSWAKFDKNVASLPKHDGIISSNDVRAWEAVYTRKMNANVNSSSARVKGTPEDTLYTVVGYIYDARLKANDCDLHIEIGNDNVNAPRIVAEVPHTDCKLQDALLAELEKKGFTYKKQNDTGIKITITGPGFWDGLHPEKEKHKYERGNTWEIHPVLSFKLLGD